MSLIDQIVKQNSYETQSLIFMLLFWKHASKKYNECIGGLDYSRLAIDLDFEIKKTWAKENGFYMSPKNTFDAVLRGTENNDELYIDVANALCAIECVEPFRLDRNVVKDLFSDYNFITKRLGSNYIEKNQQLLTIMRQIDQLEDVDFSTLYESFLKKYHAMYKGEYYTPDCVAELMMRLAVKNLDESVDAVYDPTCGCGNLLSVFDSDVELYGQEINFNSYNLCRMNLLTQDRNYKKMHIVHGNTLSNPDFLHEKFSVIVANPPFSQSWRERSDDSWFDDARFNIGECLPPAKNADFAYILHCLHYLNDTGRCVMITSPGILYRDKAEGQLRQYLIEQNVIESVLFLPPKLFKNTTIPVCILILNKNKEYDGIQLFRLSDDFYENNGKFNTLTERNIDDVVSYTDDYEFCRPGLANFIELEELKANNYLLQPGLYRL